MNFLLVDDHQIVRLTQKIWLLEEFPGSNVDEASNADEAVLNIKKNSYDLIVSDVVMDNSSDFGLLQQILLIRPEANVIIISMLSEEIYGIKFLQAGAKSYLSKNIGAALFIDVVKKVLAGGKYISENLWDVFIKNEKFREINPSPFDQLSQRETEVIKLFLSGYSNNEISQSTNLNPSTVSRHKMNSFKKLGVETLGELENIAKIFQFS